METKKYALSVQLNGDEYSSSIQYLNDEELKNLKSFCERAVNGYLTYLNIENETKIMYFNTEQIKQSIISIVKVQ